MAKARIFTQAEELRKQLSQIEKVRVQEDKSHIQAITKAIEDSIPLNAGYAWPLKLKVTIEDSEMAKIQGVKNAKKGLQYLLMTFHWADYQKGDEERVAGVLGIDVKAQDRRHFAL